LHVPTAAKINVYCFFSLGTAVKLVNIKNNKKNIFSTMFQGMVYVEIAALTLLKAF